jgi:prepilin-type N-terminal cleavage/methylation domain-containing protein
MKMKLNFGFTLVEIAIVLVIVGLLLAAFLTPLRAQIELRNISETRNDLSEIKEALIGFALSHTATLDGRPFLPCPDTDGDGAENRIGNVCTQAQGGLPFSDLGLTATDSWNNRFIYRVAPGFSNSSNGFTLFLGGDITLRDSAAGNVIGSFLPAIVLSLGENGSASALGADEQENIDGNAVFVSKEFSNSQITPFDDLVIWLSTNTLMNKMVTAGRLP